MSKSIFKNNIKKFALIAIGLPLLVGFLFFLATKIKESHDPDQNDPNYSPKVGWKILSELNAETGEAPEKLKELSGKSVRVPGFIVPLEDKQQIVREFLLVPYAGACIHVPPPPANQMIYVIMEKGEEAAFTWEPIWVTGVIEIAATTSPYGRVAFTMKGKQVRTIRPEDEK